LKIIFSDDAELGIERIGDWIARDDPLRAASFSTELRDVCEALRGFPKRFPRVGAESDLHKRTYGNYLILYQAVTIIAIEHASRDLTSLL
jgi:plasmid stabilization system protein ParE